MNIPSMKKPPLMLRSAPCLTGIALALSHPLEERCNRRPIRRAFPDMMKGHLPRGVHENVSPQLVNVASGTPQPVAPADQLDVRPPGGGPPDRRPSTATHPIGAIEDPPPVNQQGPSETRLAHVLLGTLSGLERHNDDLEAQLLDLVLVPSQLRQVLTAGQSTEVAVEDHQQPAAAKLLDTMHRTGGVLQRKRDGRRPDLAFHFALTCLDSKSTRDGHATRWPVLARLQRPTTRGLSSSSASRAKTLSLSETAARNVTAEP
jgi:hypothetical protein